MWSYMQGDSAKRRNGEGKPESRIRLTVYVRFGEEFSETQSGNRPGRTVLTLQGVQFTANAFTQRLLAANVQISMDGRGRALDNVFVERLWRSVKYEHLYLHDYITVPQLEIGLTGYFEFYNHERLHQSLAYRTPAAVHWLPQGGC
jgi:putative transposase